MRILVCGSRTWDSADTIRREFDRLPSPSLIIHGGCHGADKTAGLIALVAGSSIESYPVDHAIDGPWPAAGPRRNARMLRAGKPDRGLAFGVLRRWYVPQDDDLRTRPQWRLTGTGDMVRRMLDARLPVRWIEKPGGVAMDLTEMPPAANPA